MEYNPEQSNDPLDAVDRRILDHLQRDAKITIKALAAQLSMSTTPVHERIKKLERNGYINSYRAILEARAIGLNMVAFCSVILKAHTADIIAQFEKDMQALPEVVECYHIAGQYDYLLKVYAADMDAYQAFVTKRLAAIENIGRVQSSFMMTEVKRSHTLPLS